MGAYGSQPGATLFLPLQWMLDTCAQVAGSFETLITKVAMSQWWGLIMS